MQASRGQVARKLGVISATTLMLGVLLHPWPTLAGSTDPSDMP
jgi:hypothetical protein